MNGLDLEQFKNLIEKTTHLIYSYNRDGIFEYISPGVTKWGYSVEDIIGHNVLEFIYEDDIPRIKEIIEKEIRDGKGENRLLEFRIKKKDRTIAHIEEVSTILFDNNNVPSHIMGILRDVSIRRSVEEERKIIQNKLTHAEKMASIGMLAAGVAHEINNPLTIIQGNASLLKDLVPADCASGKAQHLIERLIKSAERIGKIVNGLRAYARENVEENVEVDMHDVIDSLFSLLGDILRKRDIEIIIKKSAAHTLFYGNGGKMQQIIFNLLSNSSDSLENISKKIIIVETSNPSDNKICLKISDNGKGIPKNILYKIFEPFFTTKAPGKGVGLGLSICESLAHSMKGTVSVVSEENVGTTVSVTLPSVQFKNK